MIPRILNLDCWKEVEKALYRFVIAAGAAYEIHVLRLDEGEPIEEAKANLYIVGDWVEQGEGGRRVKHYFSRELLLEAHTVAECLEAAYEDDKKSTTI